MASKVAGLFVSLDFNYSKFVEGLDKSRTKATVFGVAVGNIMSNIALSVGRMVKDTALSLPRLVEHSIDVADSMGKAAQKAQVSVEAFSALAHAADLSDVSVESLTSSLGRFGRNIAEAQSGNKKLASAFNDVGVSLGDLQTLKVDEVFAKVAGGFAAIPDGAKKAQVGFNLFGKSYQDLIPLLNTGSEGIAKTTARARELGIVISEETARKAELFNDNLKDLSAVAGGFGQRIAAELLPNLNSLTNGLIEFSKQGDLAKDVASGIGTIFSSVSSNAVALAAYLQSVIVTVKTLDYEIVRAGNRVGIFSDQYLENIDRSLTKAQDRFNDLTDLVENLKGGADTTIQAPKLQQGPLPEFVDDAAQKKLESLVAAFQKSLKPADDLNKELNELVAAGTSLSDITKVYGDDSEKAAEQQRKHAFTVTGLTAQVEALNQAQKDHAIFATTAAISDDIFKTTLEKVADGSLTVATQLGVLHEQMAKTADELEKLQAFGKPRDFGFIEAMNLDDLEIQAPKVKKQMEDLAKTGQQIGVAISAGIEDAMLKWEGFGKLAIGVLNDIAATILRNQVTAPLTGWLGNVLGSLGSIIGGSSASLFAAPAATGLGTASFGSFLSSLTGTRAEGGSVTSGGRFLVGERGPELFVPNTSGQIIPNGSFGGGNQTIIYQNMTINGDPDPSVIRKMQQALKETYLASVRDSLTVIQERKLRTA